MTSVTEPEGSVISTPYAGNQTMVTDQAGKARKSVPDALGRLTQVVEDPLGWAYQTNYTYDAQDNLTTVQQGVQTRTFSYNSLKQLTSATNPESGTVGYAYDVNGNLTSKTDARGITTSYAYDALNRVTSRSYSDLVTPAVNYSYDSIAVANAKGRLTQVSSTASTTNYSGYDVVGRITGSSQTTNGQTYSLSYGYNLGGGLTSQTYPSGRIVTTSYDAAGRINSVNGQKTGEVSKTYTSLISYAPQGAIGSMTLGNNLTESTSFNNRLQPTSINLGTLATFGYNYGTTNNNGNVLSQAITAPGFSVTQNYTYDPLNRLTGVSETSGWNQTYGYDRYGNRNAGSSSSAFMPLQVPTISESSNKITAANYGYDLAGNLTQGLNKDGVLQAYAYDAENKLVNFNNGAATYAYDGDGRRVKKVVGSATTIFVYNVQGQLIAEYTTPAPTTTGGTSYLTADHLGSTRVVTNQSGSVIARHDYLPFGEEIPSGIGGRTTNIGYAVDEGIKQRFTAKERDTESGLDYFGARYFSSGVGRFESADTFNNKLLQNPQDLNLYVYTINNPLRYVDPNGRDWKDYALGISQGVQNFGVNTYNGLKTAVQHPSTLVTGTVDALKTAGQAYFTSAGRSQLAAQFSSLSTQEKTAVVTEALSQGVLGAVLTKGVGAVTKALTGTESTQLFRAVGSAEAKSIGESSTFTASPTGSEFKGFFTSEADAQSFGSRMTQLTGDPHTVVTGEAPTGLVNTSPVHNAATEGPGVLIKVEDLPKVKVVDPR